MILKLFINKAIIKSTIFTGYLTEPFIKCIQTSGFSFRVVANHLSIQDAGCHILEAVADEGSQVAIIWVRAICHCVVIAPVLHKHLYIEHVMDRNSRDHLLMFYTIFFLPN